MIRLLYRASARAASPRVLAAALLVSAVFAGETRNWTQGSYADFEKGVSKNLSMRSDGLLMLAPRSREILDTTAPYLWALAQDSKGNLYAGGGTGAKLHRIAPDGKSAVIAEFDEALEIHAIAVDSKDRVYVATSPDGKVYRVTGNGKPEVFYEPGAKYIWAMALNSRGDLFVATGDEGEVHRVTPDGAGKVFFKVDEAHVRAMTVDSKDNLVLGTEPGGLVLRVSPAGEGFVLYQMPRREVTAVAVAPDGSVYAAAVGVRPAPSAQTQPTAPAPVSAAPAAITVINPPSAGAGVPVRAVAPPPSSAAITGGTEVYRIEPGGYPRRVWGHAQDLVYAIAFDAAGRAILGAGNKGNLYRIESPTLFTALLAAPATQVTAFQTTRGGKLYAATGNPGKVYEIGPGVETEGSIESDVFDTKMYSTWGRLSFEARMNGGSVAVAARAGNVDAPQKNWSAWSTEVTAPEGARTTVPGARFIQWKATLKASPSGGSPEVEWVDVAYLPKNVEPHVDEIEMTAPNYRFPAAPAPAAQPAPTLTLPPLGARTPAPAVPASPAPAVTPTTTPPMQLAKGFVGARWVSSDPNGDALIHTVEIRGAGETTWKLLKDKLTEKYYSWDSTSFADGEYRLRITASDLPANPPAEALSDRTESDPFIIDNTPPRITGLAAARSGSKLEVRWRAADALNTVTKAEYSLDGGEWTVAAPVGGLSDSKELEYVLSIEAAPGEHTIAVRARDDYDNEVTEKVLVR